MIIKFVYEYWLFVVGINAILDGLRVVAVSMNMVEMIAVEALQYYY